MPGRIAEGAGSMTYRIAVLPGDGIGPEVTREAVRVLEAVGAAAGIRFEFVEAPIGGAAVDATGDPFPPETEQACLAADAILLGAVGGPRWDREPVARRPESGLLRLRKGVGAYANLRPVRVHPALAGRGPLRPEVVGGGIDILIVRELTGGLYYGERGVQQEPFGERAYDTMVYTTPEIERVVRMAFQLARGRRRRVISVDKSNVLETSRLWRRVTEAVAEEFGDVELEHMLVDNAAMQLVRNPGRFDVLVTENTFGDILSDLGAALCGSLGLLPSASLGLPGRPPLFEPVHGSAPDIAGRGIANPLGAIASAAMMLRYAFGLEREARAVEEAVDDLLAAGPWTPDIAPPGAPVAGTEDVGRAVARRVRERLAPAPLEPVVPAAERDGRGSPDRRGSGEGPGLAGDAVAASWIAGDYGFRPVPPDEPAPPAGAPGAARDRAGRGPTPDAAPGGVHGPEAASAGRGGSRGTTPGPQGSADHAAATNGMVPPGQRPTAPPSARRDAGTGSTRRRARARKGV
ncbi:3-isopropylmalate dehydrogenase [Thermaerobacter composti]|uniref:3-isopropylmalate dehydrogenase n=1 Tax=Thermaerobacter composti TaxID=554949 RepID=A0ABZ0QNA4_9FIRM|nr:3-isopropylmalate dehydrogenase [Thermaerobacter composti]WPD18518.1 3-isopropylmalate dehydrogenase [Thermaerobacter composti]